MLRRAKSEGSVWPIVTPMEKGSVVGLETPAQPPGDLGDSIFGTRAKALDATVLDVHARAQPELGRLGTKPGAIEHADQKLRVVGCTRLK